MSGLFALVVYSRDRHPSDHCSFAQQGGPWPVHCVDGSEGSAFHPDLPIVQRALILDKATTSDREAYSDFDGTGLGDMLRQRGVDRCVVAGLATDYCVKATVLDALSEGFETWVVTNGIAAVDVEPGDGERALAEMQALGAHLLDAQTTIAALHARPGNTAFLVVDAQNDFFPGGALAVPSAPAILPVIRQLLDSEA